MKEFYIHRDSAIIRRFINNKEINQKEYIYYISIVDTYDDRWGHATSDMICKTILTQDEINTLIETLLPMYQKEKPKNV